MFILLPNEVLLKIFGHLSIDDQIRAEAVCRKWSLAIRKCWEDVYAMRVVDKTLTLTINQESKTYSYKSTEQLLCIVAKCGMGLHTLAISCLQFEQGLDVSVLIDLCPNLVTLSLNKISLASSSMFKIDSTSMTHLALDHFYIENFRRSPNVAECINANLTHLRLNCLDIDSSAFAKLCKRLAHTLVDLRLTGVVNRVDRSALTECLIQLTQLVNLTFRFCLVPFFVRNYGIDTLYCDSLLDDNVLRRMASSATKLESVNIHGSMLITANGVNALVTSLSALKHLSLISCPLVSERIFDGVGQRPKDAPMLTIDVNKWTGLIFTKNMQPSEAYRVNKLNDENIKDDDDTFCFCNRSAFS